MSLDPDLVRNFYDFVAPQDSVEAACGLVPWGAWKYSFRRLELMQLDSINEFKSNKVKRLPASVIKDIEQKNHARKLASLPPIKVKIRRCISCNELFESAGNRTCGCASRQTGYIAGREII
jgi:hypothetical protein